MNIQERVKNIICDQLAVEPEKVTETASFIDDLGADSLDIVELVMTMEEEFELDIPDEDAEKMKSVGDVISYIKTKKG
jgi:acyl carrier protein